MRSWVAVCDGCGGRAPGEDGHSTPTSWVEVAVTARFPGRTDQEFRGDACSMACLKTLVERVTFPVAGRG